MRLSPLDIQHMDFQRAAGGYHRRQVREFLDRIAQEREELLREQQTLRDEHERKDEQIAALQAAEAELQRAIIAAERIGNEIKENAKKEAQLVLREAERLKEDRLQGAEARLREARAELARVEREYSLFREQFRGMLEAYARSLDSHPQPQRQDAHGAAGEPSAASDDDRFSPEARPTR
ncbi:MAG TPA: DivIVA domain-containing protein [Trueperaceae bacterium]|nr:DivIVA domain-containing protein [Trueperaceae bacterium]